MHTEHTTISRQSTIFVQHLPLPITSTFIMTLVKVQYQHMPCIPSHLILSGVVWIIPYHTYSRLSRPHTASTLHHTTPTPYHNQTTPHHISATHHNTPHSHNIPKLEKSANTDQQPRRLPTTYFFFGLTNFSHNNKKRPSKHQAIIDISIPEGERRE